MGTKTENALLPPESARAIYSAIETASENVNRRIDDQNRSLEGQNRVLDKIVASLEQVKDKLNAGAVRFEHQSGEIKRLDGEVKRLAADVSDVESTVQKIAPRMSSGTPTTPFPAKKYPQPATSLTPRGVPIHQRNEDDDAPIVTVKVRWRKIANAAIIAIVSVFATIGATWLADRMSSSKNDGTAPHEAGIKPKRIEPPIDLPGTEP